MMRTKSRSAGSGPPSAVGSHSENNPASHIVSMSAAGSSRLCSIRSRSARIAGARFLAACRKWSAASADRLACMVLSLDHVRLAGSAEAEARVIPRRVRIDLSTLPPRHAGMTPRRRRWVNRFATRYYTQDYKGPIVWLVSAASDRTLIAFQTAPRHTDCADQELCPSNVRNSLQQTSEQLPTYLAERPHSNDGEAAWNDRLERRADRLKMAESGMTAFC
jgi:hypothetical protein